MNSDYTRRRVLEASATAAAALTAATGVGAGRQDDAYGGHLADENTWDGKTYDLRGQERAMVIAGAIGNGSHYAYDPPVVLIDPGTTVVWLWSGDGGLIDVTHDELFKSKLSSGNGDTFTYTFEDEGAYPYYSRKRREWGMKGVVVVGAEHAETEIVPFDGVYAEPDLPAYETTNESQKTDDSADDVGDETDSTGSDSDDGSDGETGGGGDDGNDGDETDGDDENGAGFGVGGALLGVGGAGYLLGNRRDGE